MTLVNIQGSDAWIRILRVLIDLKDDFRPKLGLGCIFRGHKLILAFLDVMLISSDFHEFQVKETLALAFAEGLRFCDLHFSKGWLAKATRARFSNDRLSKARFAKTRPLAFAGFA
uniref:Uncharacterized protein n=1 Tax=Solanum tuberosum TaxID=4113 RepID=M1DLL4_SOLTU